jgi:pimeloyl-ACP methyl ester carboxylesterase
MKNLFYTLIALLPLGVSAQVTDAIPMMSMDNIAYQGFFYAGGEYVREGDQLTMGGAMYVEVMVPKEIKSPYPVVFFHGAGQTGVDWLQTPDGRPGWAYDFLDAGYVVYMEDYPGRGRSQYVPDHDGPLNIRNAPNLEEIFTASAAVSLEKDIFPQAPLHTQWPGSGRIGDKIFDDFNKTQVQFMSGQDAPTVIANIALLDMINTPVILLTHSQGGAFGWPVAQARPDLVKAIITVEPAAPPIRGVDTTNVAVLDRGGLQYGISNYPIAYEPAISDPGELDVILQEIAEGPDLVPCYQQVEPARQLANLGEIPVLFLNGEGSYHRIFDHCLANWLNQAGVETEYVRLEEVGITGNGHMMMLEKNSKEISSFMLSWIEGLN